MGFWSKKKPASADVDAFTLAEVRDEPAVAAALGDAPRVWRNCSFRDEENPSELDMPLDELLNFVWVSRADGWWEIGLGDELFAALDLDAPEDEDAVVATLLAHPAVTEGYHEDREVYRFLGARDRVEAVALVASALVAGHRAALRRAGFS